MAEAELANALKDINYKSQSASSKERKEAIDGVIRLLGQSDVSENVIKEICKVILQTLPRYRDNYSRQLVNNLIIRLLKDHPSVSIKYLTPYLLYFADQQKNIIVTNHTSKTALFGLTWSTLLLKYGWKYDSSTLQDYLPKIVEMQSYLITPILGCNKLKRRTKAFTMFKDALSSVTDSEKMFLDVLKSGEQSKFSVVLASLIVKKITEDNRDLPNDYLEQFIDTFIKNFISCKTRPCLKIILACYPLISLVNKDLFKKALLPASQKAMLRNPEIILQCVGSVISGTQLDLSDCASEIGTSLITNLHSKDDSAREEAADACKSLAQKISDVKAIEELLKKTFAVFNGSNGKLTVVDQKISVLQGAGNLSHNAVPDEQLQNLIVYAAESYIKVLEVEVHEKTLSHTLEMMSLWTRKIVKDVPNRILDTFKKGMTLKTSTPLVKIAYLQCMLETFNSKNVSQVAPMVPTLLKSVEKAVSQPTIILSVGEGLCASLLLLKYVICQQLKDNSMMVMWNAVLDMDKQIFFSEKYLLSCSEESLVYVMQLCENILIAHPEKLPKPGPFHRAILHCAMHPSTVIRRKCVVILKRIIRSLGGTSVARALFRDMTKFLDSNKVVVKSEKETLKEGESYYLTGHSVTDCVKALCASKDKTNDEIQLLALDSFLPTHHIAATSLTPDLWEKVVRYFGCKARKVIEKNASHFTELLVDKYVKTQTYENALSTVVSLNPDVLLPKLIQNVTTKLEDPRICQVSKDDYFTFLTPEDQLYDKSVIPGDTSNTELNMKRESKVYSFKEQLEELQLRRELEEKKKKEGKAKPPQYTPKQLEAIKNQKAKEQGIRNRLKELNEIIENCISMIQAAARGNSLQLSLYLKDLIPTIMQDLQSPLAAPSLCKLFASLGKTVFPKNLGNLCELITFVTLRLAKPQCDLNINWESENLNKAMVRTIGLIHELTVPKKTEGEPAKERLTAPAFTYIFPLLKFCITSNHAKNHNELIQDALQIISVHVKRRGKEANGSKDLNHPRYLPTKQILSLLVDTISNTSGRIQSQTVSCLLDVAQCLSGEKGCAKATKDEIDVFLGALQSPMAVVRDAALRGLNLIIAALPSFKSDNDYALKVSKRVLIATCDSVHENRAFATNIRIEASLTFPADMSKELLIDIEHPVECIQVAAAKALGSLVRKDTYQVVEMVDTLMEVYNDRLEMIPAKLDEFGREVEKAVDTWHPRKGIALALAEMAPIMFGCPIGEVIEFFVTKSLGDRNETVRKEMLNAALQFVELHGKNNVDVLWPIFDEFMAKSSKSASYDAVKQAVVVLMGSLSRHLESDDPRIKPIFQRLIQALSTPSQTVQEAVANCLPHLVVSVKQDAPGYVNKLLHQLLKGDKYGERKGAAYGLGGMIKGMGILALKQNDVMTKLTDAIQDKKNYKHREGALFAFEMLFQMLGKLFEPYIVHVLPHLLQCFGDTSQHVRTAADDTAKVVMGKLSGHGVKLILPSLLEALEEDSWRTKTGSVELLGAMAYCAPKQLSSCLPSIVPKLIEVLSDSHMKVQEAGAAALKVIGSVIRNPEIQAIVPVLLKALQDPSNKTSVCLQTLLDTQFVHFIDAPSLALIMPVVQRAFMDRSTETRKMAAQIIGNMYSLTDQKDLMPYLPTIIPGLKTSLLDPVPEVRSVSARALGAMVRGMGESSFEDLLPWLMSTLTSETSSVDRSGAAQGLSEVVGGLGVQKLHKLMPEIISTAERTDIAAHVKDGYIMMFIYMPVVFTNEFTPYIGQIIVPILKALADENEYVRDTALKAGQRIVTLYAESAIQLLLPELEKGLFDENWRIRYSSVQLLGDLLYRISGVTGKMSTETASEDDNFGTEQSHTAIIRALGAERRNRVLAGLYMGRSDVALMVRQAALHVWKVVVTNTPKTLREILPTLFGLLLGCLASDSYDKRQVAARTLGDLVRKLGERVLPEIIPILERGLQSPRADQRQGVCIGLSEIMASTSRDMVLTFVHSLVPTVRRALCDPLPEVRRAAAKTFDSLHSTVGTRALDDILPTLLNQLSDADSEVAEWTLDGLRQVMAIKSRVVLPYLVPQLTAPPANTKALSILASVAGEALNKYLPRILPALQATLAASRGTPEETEQLEYCQAVVLSVVDDAGVRIIIDTMLENSKSEDADQRRAAATLLCAFCAKSTAQYTTHVPQLLRGLIHLCTDTDKDVLQMAWEALNAVTKTLEAKQLATYVSDVRQAVRYAMSDLRGSSDLLPGFCLPKGIAPVLPIFREAILNGDGDEKEGAALGLGEVIRVTSAQALQPSVVPITGPLIRILGDRFSANVKTAVLEALAVLLAKVGVMLKQFLPQLQTTFVKALNDPNRSVRLKSAVALGHLIGIHQRADPLFTELHNTVKNTEDISIKETTLHALRGIISPAGNKMSEPVIRQVHATLLLYLGTTDDTVRKCAAGCLGALCKYLPTDLLATTLADHILCDDASANNTLREGRAAALSVTLKETPETLWNEQYKNKLIQTLLAQLAVEVTTPIAIRSCGYLLQYLLQNELPIPNNLLTPFVRTMNNNSNDIKQLLARVSFYLAKIVPREKMSPELLRMLLPTLVNGTKEKNVYVKANSEIALIAILKLKEGDTMLQKCLSVLDAGPRESLSDVVSKVLKKILLQPEGKEEELDDTLLT